MTRTGRGADRLSAYSDAVFAVIVTIMVLQLKAPASPTFAALAPLWPTLLSYVVSYVFIAIIWVNHHHLTGLIVEPSLRLVWINFIHLFLVSLLPFTTAWMAGTNFAPLPVVAYATLFVLTDGTYNVYERYVLRQTSEISERGRRIARRRSLIALLLFVSAAVAAIFEPWVGFGLVCLALILHLKPDIGSGPDRQSRRRKAAESQSNNAASGA